jgi:hypothetical protein
MFRLIGIVAVLFVVYIGWDSLDSLYKGEISADEATQTIRSNVGGAISGAPNREGNDSSESSKNPSASSPSDNKPKRAEQLIDQMMRR